MVIFDGKKKANEILSELKKEIKKLKVKPGLAVISVSTDSASELFIKNKKKMAQEVGIKIFHYQYEAQVKEEVLLKKIKELNDKKEVNGIIVQLPLVKGLNTDKIINQIDLKKDVDGFNYINIAKLYNNKPCLVPCTAKGIMTLLDYYKVDYTAKNIVIVGRNGNRTSFNV